MGGLIRELWKGVEFGRDLMGFVIPRVYSKGKLDQWRPLPWCHIFSGIIFIYLLVLTLGFLLWATFSRLPYKT